MFVTFGYKQHPEQQIAKRQCNLISIGSAHRNIKGNLWLRFVEVDNEPCLYAKEYDYFPGTIELKTNSGQLYSSVSFDLHMLPVTVTRANDVILPVLGAKKQNLQSELQREKNTYQQNAICSALRRIDNWTNQLHSLGQGAWSRSRSGLAPLANRGKKK